MIPHVLDITIRRGDTKEIFFRVRTRVWDEETSEWIAGPYRDLTGFTINAEVRETLDSTGDPLLTFVPTVGNQADEVAGRGSVLLKISDENTNTVPGTISKGVWDCKFTEPDGDTFTYIEGAVTFKKGVTQIA